MTDNDWMRRLKEGLQKAADHVKTVRGKKKEWLVFGTGSTTELYLPCFEVEDIDPVAYVDNNNAKYETGYRGKPVIPPSKVSAYPDAAVLLCTDDRRTCREIGAQLTAIGIPYLLVAEYVYACHAAEIMENADALDKVSCAVYADRILAHLETRPLQHMERVAYFSMPEFYGCAYREVFVDIGAYVGDTIEQYLFSRQGGFSRIYAIEPNRVSFEALSARVERLCREWALDRERIQLIQAGIGKESCHGHVVSGSGTNAQLGSRVSEEADSGDALVIHKIDELFRDEHIGFLKADIEGYELDMLQGGIHVIKRDRPKLAVCIYHNCSDMYRIFAYLRQELTEYRFAVRHHAYSFAETVLYAWPAEMGV